MNGKYCMPLWSFYVNRGQAITSFGQGNKDGPIAQFKSASRAYQETEFTGFRTFIKAKSGRAERERLRKLAEKAREEDA